MLKLLLVSQSPRRSQILEEARFDFSVDTVELSENLNKNLSLRAAVENLALDKGKVFMGSVNQLKTQGKLVLTADTVVALEDQVLGKPRDFEQAKEYLRLLSGKMHSVITGVCLWERDLSRGVDRFVTASDETLVHFNSLNNRQIEEYVATGSPLDKAGAYGIQDPMVKEFIAKFDGAFDNVMGLPIQLLERLLRENGWSVQRRN